jgi:hypothetical protein
VTGEAAAEQSVRTTPAIGAHAPIKLPDAPFLPASGLLALTLAIAARTIAAMRDQ